MCYLCETEYDDGVKRPTTVVEFVYNEMEGRGLAFSAPTHEKIFRKAIDTLATYYADLETFKADVRAQADEIYKNELEKIDALGHSPDSLQKAEADVRARLDVAVVKKITDFSTNYLEKRLCSDPDDDVRTTALEMVGERYQLSKIHSQYGSVVGERDRLTTLLPESLDNWVNAIYEEQIKQVQQQLKQVDAPEQQQKLLQELQNLFAQRSQIAKLIGERVVNPN